MKQYLRDLVQILAIGAAFATIPLFAALAKLEPPWPPAMAYVSSALVLMSALVAWEWTRATHRKLRRTWIVVSLSGALLGLAAYLVAYSSFVEVNPDGGERVVRGFTCTRDAQLVYRERCPDLTARELRQAEWDPSALWTSQSITTARISLALAWLVFMAGLVGSLGAIVAGRSAMTIAGSEQLPPPERKPRKVAGTARRGARER